MKIGISIKVDVSKIDKSRLFKGQKGTYLDLTTFIDTDQPSNYGDHGFISQSVSKEEREQNIQTPILGNCKVFWGPQESQQGGYQPPPQNQRPSQGGGYQGGYAPPQGSPGQGDDVPF